jgi:hypothetical protein
MLTILEQSHHGERLKSFRTHQWKSSNNLPNDSSETFWSIKSPARKFTLIKYLQLKVLMGKASFVELSCCYDATGVLKDDLFIDALRAWKTDVPSNILWQRLQLLQRWLGLPEWSENLYYTLDKSVNYELQLTRRTIRKVKKYSGYVRNSSAVGSKRTSKVFIPEAESFEWNYNVEIDFYSYLTVGEFNSGLSGVVDFTLKMDQKSETVKQKKKV